MENTLVLLQQDFKLFLQALWAELGLPSPTRAQYAIADYLQNGPKRLQVQAFRGVGKSWITGAFVLWTLFNDPERKVMIISASKERADNMSIFLQKLIIDTPWLSHLQPKSDDSRWSRISFDVNCSPHQAPSVKSVGITGQLTGSRADLMILDDVEVPGNSLTEFMRENSYNSAQKQNPSLRRKAIAVLCISGLLRLLLLFIVGLRSGIIDHLFGRPDTQEQISYQNTRGCLHRKSKKMSIWVRKNGLLQIVDSQTKIS